MLLFFEILEEEFRDIHGPLGYEPPNPTLQVEDLKDKGKFLVSYLQDNTTVLGQIVWENLGQNNNRRDLLKSYDGSSDPSVELISELLRILNTCVLNDSKYNGNELFPKELPDNTDPQIKNLKERLKHGPVCFAMGKRLILDCLLANAIGEPPWKSLVLIHLHDIGKGELHFIWDKVADREYSHNLETIEHIRMMALCYAAHKKKPSAICLSGGGIRSASFNLGVLQGLAGSDKLKKANYLSTVSGGGYIGSWFTAWCLRHKLGISGVINELNKSNDSKLEPEPEPVRHLRNYKNFLSPRWGIFSVDTWTLIAIYFRNLFLNSLVILPILLALLFIPRLIYAFAKKTLDSVQENSLCRINAILSCFDPSNLWFFFIQFLVPIIAFFFAARTSFFISASLPTYTNERKDKSDLPKVLKNAVIPSLLASLLLIFFWLADPTFRQKNNLVYYFIAFVIAFNVLGYVFHDYKRLLECGNCGKFKKRFLKFSKILFGLAIIGLVGGYFSYLAITDWYVDLSESKSLQFFIVTAVPYLMILTLFTSDLIVGFISRKSPDQQREWKGRFNALMLLVSLGWIGLFSLVIYGPVFFMENSQPFLASIGGISGLVTLILGFASRPGTTTEEDTRGARSTWREYLINLGLIVSAPVALVTIFIFLSWFTSYILLKLSGFSDFSAPYGLWDHSNSLDSIHWLTLALIFVFFSLFPITVSWFFDINRFSLHSIYRDRLIRTFLGASNTIRDPHPFTGLDFSDNIQLRVLGCYHKILRLGRKNFFTGASWNDACLWDSIWNKLDKWEKSINLPSLMKNLYQFGNLSQAKDLHSQPFHIINMALNLKSEKNLGWQDRKAISFTASPYHCGTWHLGYRSTEDYCLREKENELKEGITLGTVMAVSGAAISPSMGYHSSPPVTFLLSLLNARLGWWVGNTGLAGDITPKGTDKPAFKLASPGWAWELWIKELLGHSNESSEFVSISDGGHFENLGLYEMVLRRCHFIVVSDATCDPKMEFGDLGNAIRKIRTDFGINIDIDLKRLMIKKNRRYTSFHAAFGIIQYSKVDKNGIDGILIYLKASLNGNEPADVREYASQSPDFPHETTGDQFFDESQFEAYRCLGKHIAEEISKLDSVEFWL